jgi:hypothetical protein
MKMFVNISNHPSSGWSESQREAFFALDEHDLVREIWDFPFPAIDPEAGEDYIDVLAESTLAGLLVPVQTPIHVMGESGFTFALVSLLKRAGFLCIVYSTTVREVVEKGGLKTSQFRFVRFRRY